MTLAVTDAPCNEAPLDASFTVTVIVTVEPPEYDDLSVVTETLRDFTAGGGGRAFRFNVKTRMVLYQQ